jgi:hypothetical protein
MELISDDEFKGIFSSSRRAFHLELKDSYNVADEDEPFRKWLNGEPDSYSWRRDWLTFIREATQSGISVQRVRVASVPHTDYFRWEIALTPQNMEAGEDVRFLPRELTRDVALPAEDFWLFDDDKLVLSIFSADGRTGMFARETDPGIVVQYRAARDQVWPRALPYSEYAL